ncbi:MAG: hypothetical protein KDA96_25255, partial [Planctomycetaceae bacterium]|nr:hypothetical protein [Planctomycetaceae bacterium]
GLLVVTAPVLGGIVMNQPDDGAELEGSQQPDGSVGGNETQQGDEVVVTWSNSYTGGYASGTVDCDEGWNSSEWFETGSYASNSFYLQGSGTWTITAKHMRGTSQVSSVTHSGNTTGAE